MKDDDMDELNEKLTKVRQREHGQAKELRKLKQEAKKMPRPEMLVDDGASDSDGMINVMKEPSSVASSSAGTFAYDPPTEYEDIIRKLENDVRTHIRGQNQLKIHLETLQWRVDELEGNETRLKEETLASEERAERTKRKSKAMIEKLDKDLKKIKSIHLKEEKQLREKISKLEGENKR